MISKLRLKHLLRNFEEEVQVRIMRILRLKGLLLLIAVVGFGGYWLLQEHIDRSFAQLWVDIKQQWEYLSFSAVIKGFVVWVRKMGYYWVTREIPKRIAIGFMLSYGVAYILPTKKRIQFKDWAKQKKKLWTSRVKLFIIWLKRDDVFGPFAGWAIGLLISLIFLVLFYSLFWIWIIIAMGFLKMPWWLVSFGRFIGQKALFILQKIPFGKGLIRLTDVSWAYAAKWLSKLRIWRPKSEEQLRKKRLRQIKIIRTVIKQRQLREAAWANFWSRIPIGVTTPEVLQLERELAIKRHTFWEKSRLLSRKGIPHLYMPTKHPGGYRCCGEYLHPSFERATAEQVSPQAAE